MGLTVGELASADALILVAVLGKAVVFCQGESVSDGDDNGGMTWGRKCIPVGL